MKSLLELVVEITAEIEQSNDLRLEAAKKLATVHKRISDGDPEAEGLSWTQFATKHFNRSRSEVNRLLKVGLADDPAAELAALRKTTSLSADKSRKSKQKNVPCVGASKKAEANGGGDSSKMNGEKDDPELGTADLIIHAYEAADDAAHNLFHDWLLDKYGYEVVHRDVTREAMRRLPA